MDGASLLAASVAYFSLLEPDDSADGNFDAKHCHLNVWSLPGAFGHRPMVFDVGILFTPTGPDPLKAITLVVPIRVVRTIDLSRDVVAADNGRLIFGRHYKSSTPTSIELDGSGAIPVVGVGPSPTVEVDGALSLVRIQLGTGVPESGSSAYLRMRFVADSARPMWRWRWVIGRRNGALVDLRVHDPREGGSDPHFRADLQGRDKPIGKLDAFFMLPERFQVSGQNPELEYTRTLEGDRWVNYLHRSPYGTVRKEPILVHRWKRYGEGTDPGVAADNPFRGYLQLNRMPGFRPATDTLFMALVTTLCVFAFLRPAALRSAPRSVVDALGDAGAEAVNTVGDQIISAGVLGAIVVIYGLFSHAGRAPRFLAGLKRRFKRLEYEWYRRIAP